jgi:proline dehydrogenase
MPTLACMNWRTPSNLRSLSMAAANKSHGDENMVNLSERSSREETISDEISSPSSNSSTTSTTTTTPTTFTRNPIPDFSYSTAAWSSKTTKDLLVAYGAFSLCRVPFFVHRAESLLHYTRLFLGDAITDSIMQKTLFGHFCAGTDDTSIQPVIRKLEQAGIGSILDFAAEDDGSSSTGGANPPPTSNSSRTSPTMEQIASATTSLDSSLIPKVRVYDYESEAKCDAHVTTFTNCIQNVARLQKDGYAAIKITALGNPKLLERMSRAIVEAQNLFRKFDQNNDGTLSYEEFDQGFQLFFRNDDAKRMEMLEKLKHDSNTPEGSSSSTPPNNQLIDYVAWSMLLEPRDLPQLTASCIDIGPLALATPTDEEVELMERMFDRVYCLAEEAARVGTRLLIDAEQTRFQPAIDNLVWNLQRKYNATSVSEFPVIYNTYQCYLKDSLSRLQTDLERSERYGFHFGAKLVRGAYMESERALATTLNYPSPIHDTIDDTHTSYNGAVQFLLKHAKSTGKRVELVVASHNQESVEKAIAAMNEIGIDRRGPTISFAQLYGMMDHLTFNLGLHGYRAYKYVPYGPVKLVMPYLIRRANENSSIAGASTLELDMIRAELKRRSFG